MSSAWADSSIWESLQAKISSSQESCRPVAVGTGFLALDIVISESQEVGPQTWAGGTCGNVLAILAFLGWQTYPISTLGDDAGAQRIIQDLRTFGVSDAFIRREPKRRTPIVIERIRNVAGSPVSRFVWTCPDCGAWLPSYQPVPARDIRPILDELPDPAVFFFDRVSRGALDLAAAAARKKALVVFEPSGVGDERLFKEAIALSHILKYSHDRLPEIGERFSHPATLLEIETLGAEGLRYRVRPGQANDRAGSSQWRLMDAYEAIDVRDPVGAGDWCTAGILHGLSRDGLEGLSSANEAEIENALRLGQALGALTCAYEGARGGMYALDREQFVEAVNRLLGRTVIMSRPDSPNLQHVKVWKSICPTCTVES